MVNIATSLTLSRIALIPALLFLVFIEAHYLALGLYIGLTLTDFFDGYLARKLNQTSALGAFLDPIADKLLVAALLIFFASIGYFDSWWVLAPIIIICREIWVPALRGFIGYDKDIAAVSNLAKWKTTSQMIALGLLLFPNPIIQGAGLILLGVAALLTFITALDYTKKAWPYLIKG